MGITVSLQSRIARGGRGLVLGVLGLALLAGPARAGKSNAVPLQTLPAERLLQLAPLLRSADIALIESKPDGTQKQITVLTLVAAPPAKVRETLLDAGRYPEFMRNSEQSSIKRNPDGTYDQVYKFNYRFFSLDGVNRIELMPAEARWGDAPPIEMYDIYDGPNFNRHHRWEFHRVGGGTLIALYGYTNLLLSGGIVEKLLKRLPALEHGLALVSQLALPLALKSRAEQLTAQAGQAVQLPPAGLGSYDFLLDRGVVVLLRSQGGRLSEMSLVDRSVARPEAVVQVAKQAARWSEHIPTYTRSKEAGERDGVPLVDLELSLPMLSFSSTYSVSSGPKAVDIWALEGDLRGAHLRWDVQPGMSGLNQIVLRAIQRLDRASLILRQLYKMEPLFEYGINVGLHLVLLNGVKRRAERESGVPAPASPPPHQ